MTSRSCTAILALSTRRLRAGGADFFACPDNTAHLALEADGPDLALPGLHIADVVVAEAHRLGHDTVGLLGTSWVLDSDMYQSRCEARGIATMVPEPADATTLHAHHPRRAGRGPVTPRRRATRCWRSSAG